MSEFDDRLAELHRQHDEEALAKRKQEASVDALLAEAWDKLVRTAQWGLQQYTGAGIATEPIFNRWIFSKRMPITGRIREKIHWDQLTVGYVLYYTTWREVSYGTQDRKYYYTHNMLLMTTADGRLLAGTQIDGRHAVKNAYYFCDPGSGKFDGSRLGRRGDLTLDQATLTEKLFKATFYNAKERIDTISDAILVEVDKRVSDHKSRARPVT